MPPLADPAIDSGIGSPPGSSAPAGSLYTSSRAEIEQVLPLLAQRHDFRRRHLISRLSGWRRKELVTIVTRRDAQESDEGAAHQIHAPESGGSGDLLEAAVGSFELTAGGFDARLQDVL